MNPFQRAREEAIKVRSKLCTNNAGNALTSVDVLANIENALNLTVFSVPSTFLELGGGSAVLKRVQRTIYVSADFVEWGDEYCGLIAHELGHWFLDPEDSGTTIADIKAVFGGEGSPAVIKVEAYGVRERQELQANVFARELLLPRNVAQVIAKNRNNSHDVAKQLGIPLEFVRQQMLDALLLPESVSSTASLKKASPDQAKAAKASEQFANVVAGPGTGKTTTLIHRVKFLIEEKSVDPSQILVLTFTNKAAFELIERLRIAGIERAADIWAGTFHAFGLEFLRKYHQNFNLEADLIVVDKMLSARALASQLPSLSLKYYLRVDDPYDWLGPVVDAITRLKEELVSPDTYQQYIRANVAETEELQRRREDVAILYQEHEAIVAEKKVVDFVDLIAKPAKAIEDDRVPYSEFLDRYQHVLVDEYQDVTQAMVELIRQIAYRKSLWVVGDVRQAIHHWRGASLKSLLKFDSEYKAQIEGGKIRKYTLENNRRSSKEILNAVKLVGERHILQDDLPLDEMRSTKGENGILPNLITCDSTAAIESSIHEQINICQSAGIRYSNQAVLCRYSSDVKHIVEKLNRSGIPVLHIGELAERTEVKVLLCIIQLLVERRPRALIGLKLVPQFNMPMQDIQFLINEAEEEKYQYGKWIKSPPPGLSSQGDSVRLALLLIVADYSKHSSPWSFVSDLILNKRICVPDESDQTVVAWVVRIALWQFAYSVRNGDGENKRSSLTQFLKLQRIRKRLGDAIVDRGLPPEAISLDGIRVETVHGSKGLEYEAVHVGYVNARSYSPKSSKWRPYEDIIDIVPPAVLGSSKIEFFREEAVERNNLLYVATSRAKQILNIYQDEQFPNEFTPQLHDCSHVFNMVQYRYTEQSKYIPSVNHSFTVPEVFQYKDFDLYMLCPLQYWYERVLELDREQDVDVSMRARGAIMSALDYVAKNKVNRNDALINEWATRYLPSNVEDPSLFKDAEDAYNRGASIVAELKTKGGIYAEPLSVIAGVTVKLPWGFIVSNGQITEFHIIRFNRRGGDRLERQLRPLINGFSDAKIRFIHIHHVMTDIIDTAKISGRVEATNSYKAAINLTKGNFSPNKKHHCNRCAYCTICPSSPSC